LHQNFCAAMATSSSAAPWTVAGAIAPSGQWGKVWLAAHWDKKLKKEDFIEANISELVASILGKSEKLTLRYMGNFLLGLCKVHAKQSAHFEDHSRELHDNLMLAFSQKEDAENRRKARALGNAAEARAAASAAESEALVVDEDLARVLASRRHLASIEDITLKPAVDDALTAIGEGMHGDTFGAASAGDKAALHALMKHTEKKFLREALPIMPFSDTLMPLVDLPVEERPALPDEADPLGPLNMDLEPLEDPDVVIPGAEPLLDEDMDLAVVGGGAEPTVKRRRRFLFDDPVEIPKEVYQGYMNDRSAITRKDEYDTTIMLPHNHPSMPQFMTTYTDMCNSLIQGLSWGSQVADRRRSVMAMAETSAATDMPFPFHPAPPPSAIVPGGGDMLISAPMDAIGAAARWEPAPALLDMSDAPSHMSAVVQPNGDPEDQSASQEARVGYSGRTEKMHKFLAKEFQRSKPEVAASSSTAPARNALSYEQICRKQSGGDRGVIAGCFFELLVLRTNGVVNLHQEKPYSDIHIEKAKSWGAT